VRRVAGSLSLPRVLSLIGGLALVAAFFMPWFGSQGLLLSGHFLHNFLNTASPTDLRRFLPTSSPTEVQLLRVLVDIFPVSGAVAACAALFGGLTPRARRLSNWVLALGGIVPLVAFAVGITRLPPGSSIEIGLLLIGVGSLAMLLGLLLDVVRSSP
jgi:hypothetical protein